MVASNQLAVFALLLIVSQVSTENYYKPSITCYTKYEHEETRNQVSNNVLSYAYSQAEMTHSLSPEGELCSNVGCACFSYRSACSHSSQELHHYSQCTDTDRHNRIVKWHHGLTSFRKCEQMRKQPQTYLDLTCCQTDRCNDQPGRITKTVDSNMQSQYYDGSVYRNAPVTDKPTQSYDQSLQTSNSLSSVSLSSSIICLALLLRFIILKQTY